jgi:hypothetical protein
MDVKTQHNYVEIITKYNCLACLKITNWIDKKVFNVLVKQRLVYYQWLLFDSVNKFKYKTFVFMRSIPSISLSLSLTISSLCWNVEHLLPFFLWCWRHLSRFLVSSIFSCMCMFCRSLFVLLYFFFWPLCFLFFIDLRILITSLCYLQSFLYNL